MGTDRPVAEISAGRIRVEPDTLRRGASAAAGVAEALDRAASLVACGGPGPEGFATSAALTALADSWSARIRLLAGEMRRVDELLRETAAAYDRADRYVWVSLTPGGPPW